MNLNHLRAFAMVASEGSLTRAAHQLGISQPAVSKQLADLEQDLGTPLFDRLPRGVRATAAGELLRGHAERILAAERSAEADIAELSGLGRGSLAVGASTTIGSYMIPQLFGAFQRLHPTLQLRLEIANTAAIQTAVLDDRVDLGLTEGFVSSDALAVEVVAQDEMLLIAAPDSVLLQRGPLRAADLTQQPMLMRESGSGTRDVIEAALARRGISLQPTMTLGSTEALKHAVGCGLGLAIVSRLSVQLELQSGRLVELPLQDLRIRRALHLLQLRHKSPSPATAAFLALLHARQSDAGGPPGGRYTI